MPASSFAHHYDVEDRSFLEDYEPLSPAKRANAEAAPIT